MKARTTFCLSLFLPLLLASAGMTPNGYGKVRNGKTPDHRFHSVAIQGWTFSGDEVKKLTIRNASGNIRLQGSANGELRIKSLISDGGQNEVLVNVLQHGDQVTGQVKYLVKSSYVSVSFMIEAPPGMSVELSSSSGEIAVENYQGKVKLEAGSGNILLRDLDGDIKADTGSGRLEVSYSHRLQQSDNSALLSEIERKWAYEIIPEVSGKKTNIIHHPSLDARGQRVFSTGSGRIVLNLAAQTSADLFVEALSQKFQFHSGRFEDVKDGVRYRGSVNGGGPLIILSTGSGSITVNSPDAR